MHITPCASQKNGPHILSRPLMRFWMLRRNPFLDYYMDFGVQKCVYDNKLIPKHNWILRKQRCRCLRLEVIIRLWSSTVSKRGSHRTKSFFIPKMTCTILKKMPFDIFMVQLAGFYKFTLGSFNMTCITFFHFFWILSVLVWSQRKSINHF